MSLVLTVMLSLLIGCASGTKTNDSEGRSSLSPELEADLAAIRDEDFLPVPEVPFNIRQDFFPEELVETPMARESLEGKPEPVLRKISGSTDPVGRIVSLCYRGEFIQAEQEMDRTYRQLKSHPSYWNQIGTCYFLQGKSRQALLYYNKALDINKTYAPAINNTGVIYYREGKHQRALSAFKEASQLNSFSITPSYNVAVLQLQYGFIDSAEQVLLALRRRNQSEPELVHALGTIALMKNDAQRAAGIYRTLDSSFYRHPSVGINFALALKMIGRPQDAMSVLSGVQTDKLDGLEEYYRQVEQSLRNSL